MGNVTVKVSDKGFNSNHYTVKVEHPFDWVHNVNFELDESLQEATIFHGLSPDAAETAAAIMEKCKDVPLLKDLLNSVPKDTVKVVLTRADRSKTVRMVAKTNIKLGSVDTNSSRVLADKNPHPPLGEPQTTSGTIEVSGGVGGGKPS